MSGLVPLGFRAAGGAAGLKESGAPDLAVVAAAPPGAVPAAAVFTRNLAAAAPVQLSRRHLAESAGRVGAVVLNSGCANAGTGESGLAAAAATARAAGQRLGLPPEHVLVCSTGVIGTELPLARLEGALPGLCDELGDSEESLLSAARAIMTTDTHEKLAWAELAGGARLAAIAKGAAMLAPDMATMLAVLLTDAVVAPDRLHVALARATGRSFNDLSVDGCTSTNDTVIVLASGASGVEPDEAELTAALTAACRNLAHQMAADAEGGTKVVRVVVSGALDHEGARAAARRVAESSLVKCSWYGGDPNWGRVLSELGTAGTALDPARVRISYGRHTVCSAGVAAAHDEAALADYLAGPEFEILCELGLGDGRGEILSADLTHGYVDENMGRS